MISRPARPGSPRAAMISVWLKSAARQASGHAADDHCEPGHIVGQLRRGLAEIGVVADQAQRGCPGDDHRGEHGARGAGFEGMAEFLDGEDDSGQRRVERGGDARGSAGQHQRAAQFQPRQAQQVAQRMHDGGADLDGRPFAADRGAAGQAQQRQQDLAHGDAQRQHAIHHGRIVHVQGGDGLRYAAALGAGKHMPGQQEGDRQSSGCDDEWQPYVVGGEMEEQPARPVRRLGKRHGDRRNQHSADPENDAAPPQARRHEWHAPDPAQTHQVSASPDLHAAPFRHAAQANVPHALRGRDAFACSLLDKCFSAGEAGRQRHAPAIASERQWTGMSALYRWPMSTSPMPWDSWDKRIGAGWSKPQGLSRWTVADAPEPVTLWNM